MSGQTFYSEFLRQDTANGGNEFSGPSLFSILSEQARLDAMSPEQRQAKSDRITKIMQDGIDSVMAEYAARKAARENAK
jgi:hypothetical protein